MPVSTSDLVAIFDKVSMDLVGDCSPVQVVQIGPDAPEPSWVEYSLANDNVLRGYLLDDREINLVLMTSAGDEVSRVQMTYCPPELIEQVVDHFAAFSTGWN